MSFGIWQYNDSKLIRGKYQLMVMVVGLGPGGLRFESGYTQVTIPFKRGSQESKTPSNH